MPRSHGAVPSAKSASVSAPAMKLPVLTAYTCIASVKPQGKKNVSAPVVMVPMALSESDQTFFPKNFGKVTDTAPSLGEKPVSPSPSMSMSAHAARVTSHTKPFEKPMNDPKAQRSPQKNPKPRTRQRLKKRCGSNLDHPSVFPRPSFHFALIPRTSQPIRAMQLDTPAVRPIRNATESVGEDSDQISQNENPKCFEM